jgi:hypothetical protein
LYAELLNSLGGSMPYFAVMCMLYVYYVIWATQCQCDIGCRLWNPTIFKRIEPNTTEYEYGSNINTYKYWHKFNIFISPVYGHINHENCERLFGNYCL